MGSNPILSAIHTNTNRYPNKDDGFFVVISCLPLAGVVCVKGFFLYFVKYKKKRISTI